MHFKRIINNMPRKNPFLESHTNLTNEITGEYYKNTNTLPWLLITIIVSAVTVIIVEWSGLADWLLAMLA